MRILNASISVPSAPQLITSRLKYDKSITVSHTAAGDERIFKAETRAYVEEEIHSSNGGKSILLGPNPIPHAHSPSSGDSDSATSSTPVAWRKHRTT